MLRCVAERRTSYLVQNISNRWIHDVKNPPDNAPTLNENDQWLDQLAHSSENVIPTTVKNPYKSYKPAKEVQYKVVERLGKYGNDVKLSSPMANFSSTNYLKQFNSHHHRQGYRQSNFQDTKIIHCKSGDGGDGCISFFRDANRRVGPPDGGDGGQGGSIYIQAVKGLNSLTKLSSLYTAPNGSAGQAAQLDGARGKDFLIKVPVGSTVRWCMDPKIVKSKVSELTEPHVNMDSACLSLKEVLQEQEIVLECMKTSSKRSPFNIKLSRDSDDEAGDVLKTWLFKDKSLEYHMEKEWFNDFNKKMKQYDRSLVSEERKKDLFPLYGIDLDLDTTGTVKLLEGGKGGLGNMHFLTSMIRNPRFAKRGRPGLESWFLIELKIIADIGLIGFPNAGKSTILNKISNAKPRIGHWEFTTLTPSIGTVSPGLTSSTGYDDTTFTVADIPGIVKDAHLDRGMGLEFLKHIERSKCWCFVLSLENKDPLQDFETLINEVGGLQKVKKKEVLVVANKADLTGSPESVTRYERVADFCQKHNWDILPISALENHNLDLLTHKMKRCVTNM